MQETTVGEALRVYVSVDEPPLGLTSEGMLAAGRRSRRNRRLAGAAVAVLAVALLGGAVVVSVGASASPQYAAVAECPYPAGPRPPEPVAADQPLAPGVLEWAKTRLTCHLVEALPRLLPQAQYAQVPGAPAGPLVGYSHGGEPPFGNRVDAVALIRDAKGTGDLLVTVAVTDSSAAVDATDECRTATSFTCIVQKGPNGEAVLISTENEAEAAHSPPTWVVRVYRGQTAVTVEISTTAREPVDGEPPGSTRPEPLLTADQALDLALSPELYFFP
jgi:hypothetical protein